MLPLVVGLVELGEQPGLLMASNIIGIGPEVLKLGLPVEVAFADLADDVTLPQFALAER